MRNRQSVVDKLIKIDNVKQKKREKDTELKKKQTKKGRQIKKKGTKRVI